LLKNKKILVIAAHPDDEILGCGGTILKLKKKNKFKIIFLTNGVSARSKNENKILKRKIECEKLFKFLKIEKPAFFDLPDNELDKVPLLKIIKKIEKVIESFKPEIVFTHYENCLNIDHQIAYQATITACRPIKNISVKKILSFEVLSSTEWGASKKKTFQPNYYFKIDKEIKNKIKAMKFYKSELKKYPHSRSLKAIETLAKFRGISSGFKFAEGFILVRKLVE
tara:strand:- start:155 stop:829 length:675 start_codon:yes stop_codon:yes gene_type:complete